MSSPKKLSKKKSTRMSEMQKAVVRAASLQKRFVSKEGGQKQSRPVLLEKLAKLQCTDPAVCKLIVDATMKVPDLVKVISPELKAIKDRQAAGAAGAEVLKDRKAAKKVIRVARSAKKEAWMKARRDKMTAAKQAHLVQKKKVSRRASASS